MTGTESETAALVVVGLSLVVVGLLFLDTAPLPVKYGVIGSGFGLSAVAVYRADAVSSSD